jgi:hypothetical protein
MFWWYAHGWFAKLDGEMNKFFVMPRRIGKKCEKRVKKLESG